MAAWPTSRTFQVANADERTFFPTRRALYLVKAICPLSNTSSASTSSPIDSHQIKHSNNLTYYISSPPIPSRPANQTEAAHPKTDAAHPTDTRAAQHALEHTNSWTPKLDRRQSWSKEDQKRALQMTGIADGESKN
ncbi:unnamed protein product [Clonostachys byssicola]|uniref:Uncharacterized protein n=1 Tax=Clonostachys byssicola TaxID=160290 RepID=A0A9N9U599_9HYPO|nr:unnamed protein product [Clonostachys byssicola]